MSREIVKVFCMKGHRVATVVAHSDALVVDYVGEVWHRKDGRTGIFGAPGCKLRLTEDESDDFEAYCRTCRKSVRLNSATLRAAALERRRGISAPFVDTIDRAWIRQRGRQPLYPPDLERFKDDPRNPARGNS
jgi:hypothetical protein